MILDLVAVVGVLVVMGLEVMNLRRLSKYIWNHCYEHGVYRTKIDDPLMPCPLCNAIKKKER